MLPSISATCQCIRVTRGHGSGCQSVVTADALSSSQEPQNKDEEQEERATMLFAFLLFTSVHQGLILKALSF